MSLRDVMLRDIPEIVADLGEGNDEQSHFSWAGTDYPCGATTELAGVMVNIDGNPNEATLGLLVLKSDFPNSIPPVAGNKVVWNSRSYIIGRVRDLHGAGTWLYCADWSSGGGRKG